MFIWFQNKRFLYIMQFSTWLLFFLVILELLTRSFIMLIPQENFVPGLGNVALRNSVTINGTEGFGVTHYLANGEVATSRQSGTSVVVLGDSYTEATQVNDDAKYVSIAEGILYKRGMNVDLHNLGYAGRGIADYAYMATFIKQSYSPRIVVIQMSVNDFVESFDTTRVNYFVRIGSSLKLVHNEDFSSRQLLLRNMIRSTGLGSFARYRFKSLNLIPERQLRLIAAGEVQSNVSALGGKDFNPGEVGMQVHTLEDAYSGIELVFLIIPDLPIVQENALMWSRASEDLLIEALQEASDVPILYPRGGFIDLYNKRSKFPRGFSNTLPNFGHLNSDGHFIIGSALADCLEGIIK